MNSHRAVTLFFVLFATAPTSLLAQASSASSDTPRVGSIALEADVLAYGLNGYSGMLNLSLRNGLQVAFGTGRYDVPSFLLEGDDNFESAQWKATSTSVQVLRVTYRFRGPMKSGPALGGVILNQNWHLRSESLGGQTRFRPVSAGFTGGYYLHLTKNLYLYPTAAFTYNRVVSGEPSVSGARYTVAKLAPNGSLHMGWEHSW